uniref:Uncharacterized protein n=1 Tax=Oryza brachyantha TaxID=4533 RepID=J3M8E4_ORYBR
SPKSQGLSRSLAAGRFRRTPPPPPLSPPPHCAPPLLWHAPTPPQFPTGNRTTGGGGGSRASAICFPPCRVPARGEAGPLAAAGRCLASPVNPLAIDPCLRACFVCLFWLASGRWRAAGGGVCGGGGGGGGGWGGGGFVAVRSWEAEFGVVGVGFRVPGHGTSLVLFACCNFCGAVLCS